MELERQIARLYTKTCDIYGLEAAEGLINNKEEVLLYAGIPCRISYGTSAALDRENGAVQAEQETTLFCAPGLKLPPGCKVVCGGETYALSGVPKKYENHQEVALKRLSRWA